METSLETNSNYKEGYNKLTTDSNEIVVQHYNYRKSNEICNGKLKFIGGRDIEPIGSGRVKYNSLYMFKTCNKMGYIDDFKIHNN